MIIIPTNATAKADPYWSSVVALLHGEGATGSTTITDSSPLAANWTASGNAQVVTAQYKFGSSSIYFDGAGDYISPSASLSSNFYFGTTDWTFELWMRPAAVSGAYYFLWECRNETGTSAVPTLYIGSNTLVYYTNEGDQITGGSLTTNTWYHVAVSRVSGNTRMFLNGTQVGSTYADTTNYSADIFRIGSYTDGSPYSYSGHLDDIRITKAGRYSSNFTIPASAFPDSF